MEFTIKKEILRERENYSKEDSVAIKTLVCELERPMQTY